MTKRTYTPKDRDRVETVLGSLLSYADSPYNYSIPFESLHTEWENQGSVLQVTMTKNDISLLIKEYKGEEWKKWEIGLTIEYLKELNFIRGRKQQGKTNLSYRIELVSKTIQANIDEFNRRWKEKRNEKLGNNNDSKNNVISNKFDKELAGWKQRKINDGVIYSAPAAAFFGGEHAVVFGHPAIYYPLPLRLYVHAAPDMDRHQILFDEYIVPDPKNINNITNIKCIDNYGDTNVSEYFEAINQLFSSSIYPFLFNPSGFNISIISSFPIAVGLNSSGAFAVCFARLLVDNYLDIERLKKGLKLPDLDKDKVILLLAWAIENCSHGNCSSGAGIHASFYGRKGKHPLIYCCSRRSRLSHRLKAGWSPVNLEEATQSIKHLLNIKTFIFDPAHPGNQLPSYPDPPPFNITLLYSGVFSKTKQALSKHSIRTYKQGHQESVRNIYDRFNHTFSDRKYQRSVEIHISEIIGDIYLNKELNPCEKSDQLDFAYLELLAEALGNVCVGLMNSVLSDWKYVPDLMNSCQYILSSLEYSHRNIDYFVARLQANALEYKINNNDKSLLPKMSAKFTGAGKGGDLIVFSLYEPDIHQRIIQETRNKNNTIHFDSSIMPNNYPNSFTEGVRQEF